MWKELQSRVAKGVNVGSRQTSGPEATCCGNGCVAVVPLALTPSLVRRGPARQARAWIGGALQMRKSRPQPGGTCPRSLRELKTVGTVTLHRRLCVSFLPSLRHFRRLSDDSALGEGLCRTYHGVQGEMGVRHSTSVPRYWAPSFPPLPSPLGTRAWDTSHAPMNLHFCACCSFFQMLPPHTPETGKLLPTLVRKKD